MSKWLTIGVSIISVAAVGYFNFFYQPQQALDLIQLPLQETCRINQQACQVQLNSEQTISLSLTPFNAKPMTPLSVNLNGSEINSASIIINGVNMSMQGFPVTLAAVNDEQYYAETALAICILGEMQWQADLTITVAGQSYLVPFQFNTTTN
ncbi:hypothetical protein HWV00_01360 [Moritella sp. 24]|uniref:hypothetical protein n=1 Tax=Moritella sp. 24 TaxID=2746230 RepID=UPI001BAD97DE|nr:hypothetical protein [Moritella sp. 24]QUM75004.1 hypothetical protein HWV00_01360 [Moritella sp. 24]